MGKQALGTAQTRIHDAMRKALSEGCTVDQLEWIIGDSSVLDYFDYVSIFQVAFNKPPHPPHMRGVSWGFIDGCFIRTDDDVSGPIAILQSNNGHDIGGYFLTVLDFSEADNA